MTALTLTGVLVLLTVAGAGLLAVSGAIVRWLLRDHGELHLYQPPGAGDHLDHLDHPECDWSRFDGR